MSIFSKNFTAFFLNKFIGKQKIMDNVFNDKERWMQRYLTTGYFVETGWWNSFENRAPFDADNNPIPWITYSAIEFLDTRLTDKLDLFEFGSGNSSLYYAKKVNTVASVEHDNLWYEEIKSKLPDNSEIFFEDIDTGNYVSFLKEKTNTYHIIIVDGRKRVECIRNSTQALTEDGVLILDDSQREEYKEVDDFLADLGFKKIKFWGIAPAYFRNKCTSVYYKPNNCLNI